MNETICSCSSVFRYVPYNINILSYNVVKIKLDVIENRKMLFKSSFFLKSRMEMGGLGGWGGGGGGWWGGGESIERH